MLLNHQCSRILEIERGTITEYDGNYDDYVLQKQQAKARVLDNVMKESIQKEGVARSILARLLFSSRDINKPVYILSGGEKIRLCFARLFTSAANVLILDEPTNYLDIPSVEALERLFSEYEGTMLFASHDGSFVNAVATERFLISDQKITPL